MILVIPHFSNQKYVPIRVIDSISMHKFVKRREIYTNLLYRGSSFSNCEVDSVADVLEGLTTYIGEEDYQPSQAVDEHTWNADTVRYDPNCRIVRLCDIFSFPFD